MTHQRESYNTLVIGIFCAALQAITLLGISILMTYIFKIDGRVIEQGERLSRIEGAQKEHVISSASREEEDNLISAKDWKP